MTKKKNISKEEKLNSVNGGFGMPVHIYPFTCEQVMNWYTDNIEIVIKRINKDPRSIKRDLMTYLETCLSVNDYKQYINNKYGINVDDLN